jgi:haloalkane dehalogenase
LLMHGEPTWSFLYRHMIPILLEGGGVRVIAPDLVGFGKSDKPGKQSDITYERMVNWMSEIVVQLRLQNVTLFAQDWGGLIGLRLLARFPERFARVCIGDTFLPVGGKGNASKAFVKWATGYSQMMPSWGPLLQLSTQKQLTEEEEAAYEAPFPSEEYKAASRVMPKLVSVSPNHPSVNENKGATQVLARFQKPFLTVWGGKDLVIPAQLAEYFKELVPGASGQPHQVLPNAGHFLQEDAGPELAKILRKFADQKPKASL